MRLSRSHVRSWSILCGFPDGSRLSGAIDRGKVEPQGWSSAFSKVQFLASDNQPYRVDPGVDITVRPMACVEKILGLD